MAAPTISALTPATGASSGGTSVVLTGTGFTGTTAVKFGTVDATAYTAYSDTVLACTAPVQAAGAVNIYVTNADGTSTSTATYTYTGSALFTVTEARAYDKAQLANTTNFPSATITAQEIVIRDKFEGIIGVALVSTSSTEYYDGDGTDALYLKHHMPYADATPSPVTLTSVTVVATDDTETDFTATELADIVEYPDKLVRRTGTFKKGVRNIKVVYTHGYATAPGDIKNAAMQALLLPPPDGIVPGSAPSAVIDGTDGTINWSRVKDPERGRWYGNESIDAVLRYHRSIEMGMGIV